MPIEFSTFQLPGGTKCMRMDISGMLSKEDGEAIVRVVSPGGPMHGLLRLAVALKQTGVAPEVRNMFASRSGNDPWSALVVNNPLVRVATNFVARINGNLRLRMFSTEEEAIQWLDERAREVKAPGSTT